MADLSLYLPPFASDYSGACSVLFEMDCLVVIIDAGCCTRNYAQYDEGRWNDKRKSSFSAQLRTLDAVLGDERTIIDQTIEAARELGSSCIAYVGTPVPAIVGMDVGGIARETEYVCGIPAIGLATTGFATYEKGASATLRTLVDRFATKRTVQGESCSVNVLGATPFDFFSTEGGMPIETYLERNGLEVGFATMRPYTVADVASATDADVSLVVSWSGLAAARRLYDRFGIPFVVGYPPVDDGGRMARMVGARSVDRLLSERFLSDVPGARIPSRSYGVDPSKTPSDVLLIGEQVTMNMMRNELARRFEQGGCIGEIAVASFFSMEDDWCEASDFRIENEGALMRYARAHPRTVYVGDPLLVRVPGIRRDRLVSFPHEAVSSSLFADEAVFPLSDELERRIRVIGDICEQGNAHRCAH